MNYAKLLLPLIISSSTFSHELFFTQQEINEQAVVIGRKMTRDRYIVYGLTAMSLVQQIYPWIAMYQKGFETDAKKDESEKPSILQSIKAAYNYLLYTKEGWIAVAQAGVGFAGLIIIPKVCDKFIHPDTLRWYIHSYAPYALTVTMMQKQVAALQDESAEIQQKLHAQKFLHLLYDRLVRQSTLMCAYMVYKTKHLEDEEKEVAQRAVRILITAQNCYLHAIKQQLYAEVVDHQELEKILSKYEEDTNCQVNHFSVIEGETMEDRYVVKQRAKRSLA